MVSHSIVLHSAALVKHRDATISFRVQNLCQKLSTEEVSTMDLQMDRAIGTKIHAALIHSTNAKWPLRSFINLQLDFSSRQMLKLPVIP